MTPPLKHASCPAGYGAQGLESVSMAVLYLTGDQRGAEAADLVSTTVQALNSSALTTTTDGALASNVTATFRATIESMFTTPGVNMVAQDVAAVVGGAVAAGSGLGEVALAAVTTAAAGEHCTEAGAVLAKTEAYVASVGAEKAFTQALKTYKEAAVDDADSVAARIVACAPGVFDSLA